MARQHDPIADKGASVEHIQVRGDDDGELTDICSDNPPPKKSRRTLVRSDAIAFIPDTRPAAEKESDGYEPDTEQEMVLENGEEVEEVEEETPKKKKKGGKPKVRDQIAAQRDRAIPMDMDVSVTYIILPYYRVIPHVLV